MTNRDVLVKDSSQVVRSCLPIPSNSKHMLPWSWLFTAEVHTRWVARQSSHFWVSFLCISYARGMISITEKNKVLIHTWTSTAECRVSGVNSAAWKGGSLLGPPVLYPVGEPHRLFLFLCYVFKINSRVFMLCNVLLDLWWTAKKYTTGKLRLGMSQLRQL